MTSLEVADEWDLENYMNQKQKAAMSEAEEPSKRTQYSKKHHESNPDIRCGPVTLLLPSCHQSRNQTLGRGHLSRRAVLTKRTKAPFTEVQLFLDSKNKSAKTESPLQLMRTGQGNLVLTSQEKAFKTDGNKL